ncbi:MAG: ATP phosphoribosyltransferase regulatory subunit [Pseudomonadota bacterium]|nr:ATP phosphoribosyltransferase regulatory subunit [Pseudomonadota bacterium]
MNTADRWLLPDGIEELLPTKAAVLELQRRRLLDLYRTWGYEFVIPPMLEYLESLLTGSGRDLDLNTFKVTDQTTGRLMGLRADITPQVARIDAHSLHRNGPTRLCYAGSVLHTRANHSFASRSPIQVGAELYGSSETAADLEVIALMLEGLEAVGIQSLSLDLGHVGIYRALASAAGIQAEHQSDLFELMQSKAFGEVDAALAVGTDPPTTQMLRQLPHLYGPPAPVLARARTEFSAAPEAVREALDQIEAVAAEIGARYPRVELYCDLAELRGYHYHTGLVFAAYTANHGQELAKGGRYDEIGRVFGRARPATGFSLDLKALTALTPCGDSPGGIYAPNRTHGDVDGQAEVRALRAQGERVVQALPGDAATPESLGCDRQLAWVENRWQVVPL